MFIQKFIGWVKGMISKKSIETVYGIKVAISDEMLANQLRFRQILKGKGYWNTPEVPSLFLANSANSEISSRAALGLVSNVEGSQRALYIDEQYQKFLKELNNVCFEVCNGEVILKPYATPTGLGVTVSKTECYFPLEYNSDGDLIDVVFGDNIQRDGYIYRLLERHTFNAETQTQEITFKGYRIKSNSDSFGQTAIDVNNLGSPIDLTTVPEWADLQDFTINNIERSLFVLIRNESDVEIESPQRQGLPVWFKGIELIRKADSHEARTDKEFRSAESILYTPIDHFKKDKDGNLIGKPDHVVTFDGTNKERDKAELFAPEQRIIQLDKRMNGILRRFEFACGLSYGIISDNNMVERTAEEFRASKERLMTTISTMQKDILQVGIEHLIDSFNVLADLQGIPSGEYTSIFEWNESYAIDRKQEAEERLRWQAAGVITPLENRAWYLETDLETAAEGFQEELESEYG